jgi:hypothetical protein
VGYAKNVNAALTLGSIAMIVAPLAFAAMTVVEAQRIRHFLRYGVKTDGEVIGEELHGIRYRAPYPVVQFRDNTGSVRQFRSLISKKSKGFIHPERVIVIYLPDHPEKAELFSGFHPYKHLAAIITVFVLSVAAATFSLPMFFAR